MHVASVEELLISSVLKTGDYSTPLEWGIAPEHWSIFPDEWVWIINYIKKHGRCPSEAAFMNKWPDVRIVDVDDVDYYSVELLKEYRTSLLISALDRAATGVEDRGNIEIIASDLQSDLLKLQHQLEARGELDLLGDWQGYYQETSEKTDRAKKNDGMVGVPTGIHILDDVTGGLGSGELWTIAGRLGQGKSWIMIRMAVEALLEGYTVQFDSLEMSRRQVANRIHSLLALKLSRGKVSFSSTALHHGRVVLRDFKKYLKLAEEVVPGKLFINDTSRGLVGPSQIAGQCERNNPDITFVDYVQLMKTKSKEWYDVATLTGEMKVIAGEYRSAIVVGSQLNRTGESKKRGLNYIPPGPETISQTDAIGQDSDGVVTLARVSKHITNALLAKYRHGEDGQLFHLHTDYSKGLIEEIDRPHAQKIYDADRMAKLEQFT